MDQPKRGDALQLGR